MSRNIIGASVSMILEELRGYVNMAARQLEVFMLVRVLGQKVIASILNLKLGKSVYLVLRPCYGSTYTRENYLKAMSTNSGLGENHP